MDDKFNNKYRIPPARLTDWDYGSHGLYYITICTKNRLNYFGEIIADQHVETQYFASLDRTPMGEVAHQNWLKIPDHFNFIELDEFIVMPNHIHGILL